MTGRAADDASRRVRDLPVWRGPVEPEPLAGGLSNRNFQVHDGAGDYVVRLVDGDVPEHGIVREREIAVSRAAHRAGIAPELVFAGEGVMVLRFIPGRTLTPGDILAPAMLDRIAALMRACHRDVAAHLRGPAPCFWVFHAVRNYLAQLEAHGRLGGQIERLREIVAVLEDAAGPTVLAVTHNDLMPGNFIDDGDRLWLIDWEYGGYGAPLFDLATLAANNELDAAARAHLLAAYFGQRPDEALRHRFAALILAARLRESLWGRVQEIHGRLDFDYRGYAEGHAATFERDYGQFSAGGARSLPRSRP
jgi:thiamine kinase-like enzyme